MQHIPTFIATPAMGWATLSAANTTTDGTTATALIFSAGANGGKISNISIVQTNTNPKTSVRIFVNNGDDIAVATNNTLIAEIPVLANTLVSGEASRNVYEQIEIDLPAGHRVYATTTVASSLKITAIGGQF